MADTSTFDYMLALELAQGAFSGGNYLLAEKFYVLAVRQASLGHGAQSRECGFACLNLADFLNQLGRGEEIRPLLRAAAVSLSNENVGLPSACANTFQPRFSSMRFH